MNRICYLMLCFQVFFCVTVVAQDAKSHLKALAAGKDNMVLNPDVFSDENLSKTIRYSLKYLNHDDGHVRYEAYQMLYKASLKQPEGSKREKSVKKLLKAGLDTDASIRKKIAKQLPKFSKNDFSEASQLDIVELLVLPNVEPDYILLAGWLGNSAFLAPLDSLFQRTPKTKFQQKQKWSAALALARMGSHESVRYIKDLIGNKKFNSTILDAVGESIIYTCHPDLYEILVRELNNDEKNCNSNNPNTSVMVLCAYRVMELLAPRVLGFPIEVNKWGELQTDNYEESLVVARKWFYDNMRAYQIDSSKF